MDSSWSSSESSELEVKEDVNLKENEENNLKNISPYMSKDLIAAAGFNVETPIVNAIIGNLTGSLPTKKSETEMRKCEICDCLLSSNIVFNFHVNGAKHQKRIKALEIIAHLKDANDPGVLLGDSENPKMFKCEICSMTANSAQQLEVHLSGAKHKKKCAKVNLPESDKDKTENTDSNSSPPEAKKKKREESSSTIHCYFCDVFMNSQTQYDQHLLSRKHITKVAGKLEPKTSPGKGKFLKFLRLSSERPELPMNLSNHAFQNEGNQYNPQMYNRLHNFLPKHPFYKLRYGYNSSNSFRQSPAYNLQRRFF